MSRPIQKVCYSNGNWTFPAGIDYEQVLIDADKPITLVNIRWYVRMRCPDSAARHGPHRLRMAIYVNYQGEDPLEWQTLNYSGSPWTNMAAEDVLTWGFMNIGRYQQRLQDITPPEEDQLVEYGRNEEIWEGQTNTMRKLQKGDKIVFAILLHEDDATCEVDRFNFQLFYK